jgi:orotidine-5'-phosphate decarboxylase
MKSMTRPAADPAIVSHFGDRLADAVRKLGNPVVVGLDPRYEQLPSGLRGTTTPDLVAMAAAVATFCRGVIDVVAPLVPAVKPQLAFFEQLGPAGMAALADVVGHARRSGLLTILDGKRNDIGSTAVAYAEAYLGIPPTSPWGGDALTVSPYLGADSLEPFVTTASERGAGVFVLVKTSNPGGGMFQDLHVDGQPLYRRVASYVHEQSRQTAGVSGY